MNKQEFLVLLGKGLSGLPQSEREERLAFYSEMIEDRIEEGLSEADAVAAVGSVEEIIGQAVAEIPLTKIAKERIKPKRRLKVWEIVLLAVGSPLWISLGIAAFAVVFSLYIVLWSVIIALWSVFGAFVGCAVGGIAAAGICVAYSGNLYAGIAMIGAALVCAGLAIFAFFGCRAATKGAVMLTKKMAVGIKRCFVKREVA